MDIKNKLQHAPSSPGIYIMKGLKKRVVYVGKAKNLKNRLRSYFQNSVSMDARKSKMVKEIRDFDYIITKNELEALVLEANFIKKARPKYNIILRDDKNYPYLKLTINEEWPRLEVTRKIVQDGSLYYGPYVPAGVMWETLKFIRYNFPLATCRYDLKKPFRPCVQYQIGRCLAPCGKSNRSLSDRQRYQETANEVKLFLQGKRKNLLSILKEKMVKHSDELEFEEAAKLRDRLGSIEKSWDTQRVISPELGNFDVIGFYREERSASIYILFIRNGMVIGQKEFFLKNLGGMENTEILAGFIEQFYSKEILMPMKIIIPFNAVLKIQKHWLREKSGKKIRLSTPKGEKETAVLKMAADNAYHSFLKHKTAKIPQNLNETLKSLKDLLKLKAVPRRIEAVDVSNISGAEAVGAVISWENGRLAKDGYRLFKIKTVERIDDFAMIEEVVYRHFKSFSEGKGKPPDLILIDGGKGQLNSAVKAIKQFNLPVEIAAIAKARSGTSRNPEEQADRIFLRGGKYSVPLETSAASTHLLQKLRDEVHRFAISYHKKLRAKRVLESPLEKIKGIGKTRRLLLLRHFGSIGAIRKASVAEISSLKGINKKTAMLLKTHLVNDL